VRHFPSALRKVPAMPDDSPPAAAPLRPSPRDLPSMDRLTGSAEARLLQQRFGRALVAAEARALLAERRERLRADAVPVVDVSDAALTRELAARVARSATPRLVGVLNLTGTVLHTNLGRAVLPESAMRHVETAMGSPTNLEYDLEAGARGDREAAVEDLLVRITGAEAATVVNNNAAAVLLTVAALARGRRVVLSRGELVEIGGSFRIPEVMASAGAELVEVGTTNRTHLQDYERAIDADTGIVMKVHTSNYVIEGFTASVDERTLAGLCRARGVPLVTDLGSGSLVDLAAFGLPQEPLPQDMLAAGCDVVTFSGDKLLGGPQAGLIVGTREYVDRIRRFPMKRALRLSKLTLAALEATLLLYLQPERLLAELPTLRWLTRPVDDMRQVAAMLREPLAEAVGASFRVEEAEMQSEIGSGSLPGRGVASFGLAVAPVGVPKRGVADALIRLSVALRSLSVPVIGRISGDRVLLDLRCLDNAAQFVDLCPELRERMRAGDVGKAGVV
jgi:L-seryl-tRNA(Ser) seleniumtransferase